MNRKPSERSIKDLQFLQPLTVACFVTLGSITRPRRLSQIRTGGIDMPIGGRN
jgi:hypothetical protein